MTKSHFLTVVCIALCLFFSEVKAQDTQAKNVLDAMNNKYSSYSAYKADFEHEVSMGTGSSGESIKGTITVKGNKFRLKMPGQEIYNDQSTVWTYLADDEEVTITNNDGEELNPSEIYSLYKNGFKYILRGTEAVGGTACHVIDLTPDSKERDFHKVRLLVSKSDNMLKKWTLFFKNGRRYSYSIKNFTANPSVSDSYFRFSEKSHPSVEVIDLR